MARCDKNSEEKERGEIRAMQEPGGPEREKGGATGTGQGERERAVRSRNREFSWQMWTRWKAGARLDDRQTMDGDDGDWRNAQIMREENSTESITHVKRLSTSGKHNK
eukprot:1539696-Pleurochrysis_carterae.AAC.3